MDAICDAVPLGLPLKQSCKSAGISERTGRNWRERGWSEIDRADAGADGELSFVARFDIAIEAALVQFMGPLVQRVNDAATGKGGKVGGDWKAAKELLAMRFPDQWSERVAVAKSQRIEVGGTISHDFSAMRLQSMSDAELRAEMESVHWSMRSSMLYGDELGEVIRYAEDKLALMKFHYAAKTA